MSGQGEGEKTGACRGRPTVYDRATADEICERLASGETLRQVCRSDGMPAESVVRRWNADDRDGFAARYKCAREEGLLAMADEMLEIADDSSRDYVATENGLVLDPENVQRSKLRVHARQWLMGRLLPRVFGDRVMQEVTGKDGGPVRIDASRAGANLDGLTDEQISALQALLPKIGGTD